VFRIYKKCSDKNPSGSFPADVINQTAVAAMLEKGIDSSDTQPKLLTDKTVELFKPVIIMDYGDARKFYSGKCYED
jgi:arsenate reductase